MSNWDRFVETFFNAKVMARYLPDIAYGERWTTLIDTAEPQGADEAEHKAGTRMTVEARSLVLLSRPSRTAGCGSSGLLSTGGPSAEAPARPPFPPP